MGIKLFKGMWRKNCRRNRFKEVAEGGWKLNKGESIVRRQDTKGQSQQGRSQVIRNFTYSGVRVRNQGKTVSQKRGTDTIDSEYGVWSDNKDR